MYDGVVIDADLMEQFYPQMVMENGQLFQMVSCLCVMPGLAVTEIIENEWYATCGAQAFKDWVTDMLKVDRIRFVEPDLEQHTLKKIHNDFGLPRKGSRD